MELTAAPRSASWTHRGARVGFEVAFFTDRPDGHRLCGQTTADEADVLWSVGYDITTDRSWRTITVAASNLTADGIGAIVISRDANDRWTVNDELRPELDGCVDVDLESSAVTNTLPIHRLDFAVGMSIDVPAAFIHADDLRVERLEQRYTLTESTSERLRFHYEALAFEFACDLEYDRAGLIVEYPGIALREL